MTDNDGSNDLRQTADCLSRRGLLTGAVASTAVLATSNLLDGREPALATGGPAPAGIGSTKNARTKIVMLGTAGGPVYQSRDRAGISTAIVYDGRVYIVDLGLGSYHRLADSGLAPDGNFALSNVRGIFFTHLHSDHTVDWPGLWLTAGLNATGRGPDPIRVFGPGDRGTLPRVFPPSRPAPPVISPEDPTLGIAGLTSNLERAFAQDLNDRSRDTNFRVPASLFEVSEIDLTDDWIVDQAGAPPRIDPIQVWQDGDVTITATLVDHHPTAPAFAYRFDTPDGSVVVSGDTTVSENLITLAQGADYLVHEVIDAAWVDSIMATLPPVVQEPTKQHLIGAHTTIEQVGRDVAEAAGAKNLVLTHFVPANNPVQRWRQAKNGYSGNLIVGADMMEIAVSRSRA